MSKVLAGFTAGLVVGSALASERIPGNPLIAVVGGRFVFGSDAGNEDSRPRRVIQGRAFAMNRTEVSNAEYRKFVAATGHPPAFYSEHPLLGRDEHPVVGVSWNDAAAFCTHYGLALPSEQEYERAARGVDGATFPWGEAAIGTTRANGGSETCCSGSDYDGYLMTAPVGAFPAGRSPEGILSLVGKLRRGPDGQLAAFGPLLPHGLDVMGEPSGPYTIARDGSTVLVATLRARS